MMKEDVLTEVPNFTPYLEKGVTAEKWSLYSNANDIKVTGEILSCTPWIGLFLKEINEPENLVNYLGSLSASWIIVNESGIIESVYWGF